jgi:hypothetical protein
VTWEQFKGPSYEVSFRTTEGSAIVVPWLERHRDPCGLALAVLIMPSSSRRRDETEQVRGQSGDGEGAARARAGSLHETVVRRWACDGTFVRHNNAGPRGSCGAVGLDTFGFGSFMTALHSTPPHSMHRRRPARWLPFGLGALEVAQQVVEVVGGEIATAQVTSVAFDARPGRPILRFFFHGGWESRQPSGPAGRGENGRIRTDISSSRILP